MYTVESEFEDGSFSKMWNMTWQDVIAAVYITNSRVYPVSVRSIKIIKETI